MSLYKWSSGMQLQNSLHLKVYCVTRILIEDKLNSTVHMCLLASSVPKADYNPDQYLWERNLLSQEESTREKMWRQLSSFGKLIVSGGVSAYLGIGFFPHYQLRTNMNLVVFEDKMV
ncbi:hypothetical protein SASPL_156165 [Salvia splendens]|uniref:Uncharacterized protein n=1 Tax=Salvia splendens TaxID=180675 RepID=A0A8X8VX24_SALSN|nr:hypothetical protein SASPL_156165 [Salvia splendens]